MKSICIYRRISWCRAGHRSHLLQTLPALSLLPFSSCQRMRRLQKINPLLANIIKISNILLKERIGLLLRHEKSRPAEHLGGLGRRSSGDGPQCTKRKTSEPRGIGCAKDDFCRYDIWYYAYLGADEIYHSLGIISIGCFKVVYFVCFGAYRYLELV